MLVSVQDRGRGFTLNKAPLMRLTVLRLAEQSYEMIWSHHHLLVDGWSLPLILKEVFKLYKGYCEGREIELSASKPYAQYMAWLQQQDLKEAEKYWREKLNGFSGPTSIGIERTGANGGEKGTYREHKLELDPDVTQALKAMCKKHQLTLNTVVQGAWAMLLSKYRGEQEVAFGVVVSGRPAEIEGVEAIVGLFINTLPVRVNAEPEQRVKEWLAQLQQDQAEMRQYEYSPLVQVQGWSSLGKRVPLFESIFIFENYPIDNSLRGWDSDLKLQRFQIVENTNYPLALAAGVGQRLWLKLTCDCSRYDEQSIKRMLAHFGNVLRGLAASPEARLREIPVLDEEERRQVLVEGNETQRCYPGSKVIHKLFEEQVERTPEAIAAVFEHGHLTYTALNRRANQLAHHLRALGVMREALVGICTERGIDTVVSMMGTLKAGAAYVPLDQSYPSDRLSYIVEDSRLTIVVTHNGAETMLPQGVARLVRLDADWEQIERLSENNPEAEVEANQLAYVMYTSGSTGKPKGVATAHQATVNRLNWMWEKYPFGADERTCQKTSLGFVDSVWEIFGALLKGIPTVIVRQEAVKNAEELIDELNRQQVTRVVTVPAQLRGMVESVEERGTELKTIRIWVSSGQELDAPLAMRFKSVIRHGALLNLYGCTEISADASWEEVRESDGFSRVPIGKAIANTGLRILDKRLDPVPTGVGGELCISGAGLARGYLGKPDLTAEKFVPNPFCAVEGERFYRTGDICRYRLDGKIEYLGRGDRQVKIRGYRIELGEIEAVLIAHDQVQEAVVVVNHDKASDKQLVAYLVGSDPAQTVGNNLRDFLMLKLPLYMVPSRFVHLQQLPLTANGKIDRKLLEALQVQHHSTASSAGEVKDQVEEVVAGIWEEVLGLKSIGKEDNFFEMWEAIRL